MSAGEAGEDVGALREAAAAATPGPWESGTDGWVETVSGDGEDWVYVRRVGAKGDLLSEMLHGQPSDAQTEADAAFVAAANPAVVLALLDRLDALTDLADRAADALDKWNWVHENPSLVIDSVSRSLRRASLGHAYLGPTPATPPEGASL